MGGSISTRALLFIGAGGHAVSLTETALAAGYEVLGFVGESETGATLLDRPIYPHLPREFIESDAALCIAIGDNFTRELVMRETLQRVPITRFPSLIHPSASVASTASIGSGSVVMQGAVVGSRADVGRGCILNSSSVLEHECQMGPFSSMAPRAVTGGRVTLGQRVAVGIGAVVRHGLNIASDTVVGAASYVHHDLPSKVVAFGSPATVRRTRRPEDRYLR